MEPTSAARDPAKKEDALLKSEEVKPSASVEATQPATEEVEEFPDPDEDDLDDLDDMLDEFSSSAKVNDGAKTAAPAAAPAPAASVTEPAPTNDPLGPEFSKEMQAGLEDLLGDLGKSPDMQAQFEQMLKGMAAEIDKTGGFDGFLDSVGGSIPPGSSEDLAAESSKASAPGSSTTAVPELPRSTPPKPSTESADPALDASFQETIRRTMERMQNSGEQATAAASSSGPDDFMSEMLKQMSSGDFNADGTEEDFSKMLMGMMEQLTNKEILYEPMKELNDKFPAWFEKNRSTTPAADLKRYEEQQWVVAEIVAKFEEKTYTDSNAADREYIVERMQKMQAAGSPPPDLVGDMDSAQDAFNATDEQCNPQ